MNARASFLAAWRSSGGIFDIAGKKARIAELEVEATAPSFWLANEKAQATLREQARLKEAVDAFEAQVRALDDVRVLIDLADEAKDDPTAVEAASSLTAAEEAVGKMEFARMLSGPYDRQGALLSINAGAGGTESQDWASMLMRMFLRYGDVRKYQTEILEQMPGDEAGIKSVTIRFGGEYAYGRLKAERGVHRLVRLSPFDANHRRHTSFALVEVMPEIEDAVEIEIKPEDIKIDIYHASGHGGQNVQKVATAVRLTHVPTGIVVTCQNERSQLQNRENALKVLRSRLVEAEIEEREQERARLKGKHVEAGWGNQIRSYVLHPYQMVKDHRTDFERGNTQAILDGDLNAFMESYLRSNSGKTE